MNGVDFGEATHLVVEFDDSYEYLSRSVSELEDDVTEEEVQEVVSDLENEDGVTARLTAGDDA